MRTLFGKNIKIKEIKSARVDVVIFSNNELVKNKSTTILCL